MNRRERNAAAHQAAALAIDAVAPEGRNHLRQARSIICDELARRPVLTAGTLWTYGTDVAAGLFALTTAELLVSTNDGPANGYYPSGLQVAPTPHGVRVVTPAGEVLDLHTPDPEGAVYAFQGEGAVVVEASDLPNPPVVPGVQPRRRLNDPLNCLIDGWVLGGAGDWDDLNIGDYVAIHFDAEQAQVLVDGTPQGDQIDYSDLVVLKAYGPGAVTEGGGVIGGGIGIEGALLGMAIAAIANALTTITRTETVLHLAGIDRELFVLHQRLPPEAIEIELSPARLAMSRSRPT
jgi:hypothetical protein